MDERERRHLEGKLDAYRRRLEPLEIQQARSGPRTPPEVVVEIEEIRAYIQQAEERLARSDQSPKRRPRVTKARSMLVGLGLAFVVIVIIIAYLIGRQNSVNLRTQRAAVAATDSGLDNPLPNSDITATQTIEAYYTAINNRQFNNAWTMLTPFYQQNHNRDGFSNYVDYWQKQGNANIDHIQLLGMYTGRTLVEVQITYPDQSDVSTFRFALIFDRKQQTWFIDQYCEIGGQPRCPDVGI